MRKAFQKALYKQMKENSQIFLLLGDLGYKIFDNHRAAFPQRVVNCGAAEQAMLDIAVGLAYDGKIPFCYSITPFLIYRPFETIRTYIDYENLPVKLVGSGRNRDYKHDGISHWADDVGLYLNNFKNVKQFWPNKVSQVSGMVKEMVANNSPSFISLSR